MVVSRRPLGPPSASTQGRGTAPPGDDARRAGWDHLRSHDPADLRGIGPGDEDAGISGAARRRGLPNSLLAAVSFMAPGPDLPISLLVVILFVARGGVTNARHPVFTAGIRVVPSHMGVIGSIGPLPAGRKVAAPYHFAATARAAGCLSPGRVVRLFARYVGVGVRRVSAPAYPLEDEAHRLWKEGR